MTLLRSGTFRDLRLLGILLLPVFLVLSGCAAVTPVAGTPGWTGLHLKLVIASIVALFALVAASAAIFKDAPIDAKDADAGAIRKLSLKMRTMSSSDPELIGLVIAFDVVVFILVGWVLLVSASWKWETATLTAGACLLGGGLLGLLFGMPLAGEPSPDVVADKAAKAKDASQKARDIVQEAAKKKADLAAHVPGAENEPPAPPEDAHVQLMKDAASKANTVAARAKSQTLLSQTASTLSKLLAGAGLVKYHQIFGVFHSAAAELTRCIDPGTTSHVLGSSVILYFGLVGFLSGLFLPAYFMKGWQD